jgi:hypothetical protein
MRVDLPSSQGPLACWVCPQESSNQPRSVPPGRHRTLYRHRFPGTAGLPFCLTASVAATSVR